ncbi:MAG: hypothetical protein ABR95_10725 [Sphingobacteriales bacterium BACL12 MAG-120813-bin55]|jgi:aminodeoxyfutalosine deaminase|nr:MAG: hypothetical protein ABR95_10725 [Sphingobacteriales bacterium BACL12 MAG-120813-bin55]
MGTMRYFSASTIHPVTTPAVSHHVLVVEEDGTIVDLVPEQEVDATKVEHLEGDLIPGFINTHCHLELSHLKGRFEEKTGLPDFLNKVVAQRAAAAQEVQEAMQTADSEMWDNGIVAVGDICNKYDSFAVKAGSRIHYHSMVELLAFHPERTAGAMEQGNSLLQQLSELGLSGSIVPHAPYSVSPALLEQITAQCADSGVPTSIHMMESNDETEFFVQGTGLYRRLYHNMGMDIDFFEPSGKTSLATLLPFLHPKARTLLVHNTIATAADVVHAVEQHANLWWCFCPNANLYIEDRLPDIPQLMRAIPEGRITLGTDSLASNHQLSVWSEIQIVLQRFPELKLVDVLPWATLNGARYLGIDHLFGSLEKGKRPGIVLLSESTIQRII